jgi:hypothetical protein
MLLDELERIFFAEGFAHLSIADLATRLQVSRTTLYRLAPGKQELVKTGHRPDVQPDGQACPGGAGGTEEPGREGGGLPRHGDRPRYGQEALAFSRDLKANEGTRTVYDRHQAIGMRVLTGLINEGARAGGFRPVPAATVVQIADAAHARLRPGRSPTWA